MYYIVKEEDTKATVAENIKSTGNPSIQRSRINKE